MKRFIFLVFLILLLPTKVSAVSVNLSNVPSTIDDQPFTMSVSVSGAASGTNYLRANLFSTGTTNYFGYTYNGSSYVNSSDYSQYLPISVDSSGNWSGTLQAQLDPSSKYYTGSGSYSLKVRRYTPSGASYTWSNEVTLAVNFATPTPSPSPTPTPTPTATTATSTSNNSNSKSTSTKTSATPAPSLTSTQTILAANTSQSDHSSPPLPNLGEVSGVASESSQEASREAKTTTSEKPKWLIAAGIVAILGGGGLLAFTLKRP